jgi:hypothetical protein
MTISNLITILEHCPPDSPVSIELYDEKLKIKKIVNIMNVDCIMSYVHYDKLLNSSVRIRVIES